MPNSTPPTTVADSAGHSGGFRRGSPTVCFACGCSCDDIELVLAGSWIVENVNACPIGERWFQAESRSLQAASTRCSIRGQTAEFSAAVRTSAELLRDARSPVVIGLTQTTIETVKVACEIADKVGALIDPVPAPGSARPTRAFQRRGRVTATLGEVKNRADVVLFWGVDPITTHPRHGERYSIEATGRFREDGRAGRTIVVVDGRPTPTSAIADLFVPIRADREFESLWAMRAILLGKTIDADRVLASTGCALDELKRVVDRLAMARYGAIFAEPTFGASPRAQAALEAMTQFVRELNHVTRCVFLPLGGAGNRAGAEAVLTWQAGFPNAVDLGAGFPQSIPGVTTAVDRLSRMEVDLALIVADAIPDDFPPSALDHLKNVPQIVVAPATVSYDFEPMVRFTTGHPFLTSAGSVIRCDGVPLPLRAPFRTDVPSDRDCLRAISSGLDGLGYSTPRRA